MELEEIARNRTNFATKQVGNDLVLVPMKDNVAEMNTMFTLNEVASFIWDNLTEDSSNETLLAAILSEFDIDEVTAVADLNEFLAQIENMMNA